MAGFIGKIKLGILWIVLLLLLGSAGIAAGFIGSHTIICTEKEYVSMKKESFGFENNYVDVRQWSLLDYLAHPEIAQALIENGYNEIQASLEESKGKDQLDETLEKTGEAVKSLLDKMKK